MRAALYRKFGPARDVLELCEVDTPEPGPGEALVKIAMERVGADGVDVDASGPAVEARDGGAVDGETPRPQLLDVQRP